MRQTFVSRSGLLRRTAPAFFAPKKRTTTNNQQNSGAAGDANSGAIPTSDEVLSGLSLIKAFGKTKFGRGVLEQTMAEFKATEEARAEREHTQTQHQKQPAAAAAAAANNAEEASSSTASPLGGGSRKKMSSMSGGKKSQVSAAASARSKLATPSTPSSASLLEHLAQNREKEEELRRTGETQADGFLGKMLLRKRPIDKLGLQVERDGLELGLPHKLFKVVIGLGTMSPLVTGIATGTFVPTHTPVDLGLIQESTWASVFGAEEGFVPSWLCGIGHLCLFFGFYDFSVYWRYPILAYAVAPVLRGAYRFLDNNPSIKKLVVLPGFDSSTPWVKRAATTATEEQSGTGVAAANNNKPASFGDGGFGANVKWKSSAHGARKTTTTTTAPAGEGATIGAEDVAKEASASSSATTTTSAAKGSMTGKKFAGTTSTWRKPSQQTFVKGSDVSDA